MDDDQRIRKKGVGSRKDFQVIRETLGSAPNPWN